MEQILSDDSSDYQCATQHQEGSERIYVRLLRKLDSTVAKTLAITL